MLYLLLDISWEAQLPLEWLVHWTLDRAVRVEPYLGTLCCVLSHDSLLSQV